MFHLFTDEYDDVDGNGYYDVNDFLKMDNNEILKENSNKKWDCVIQNPPYGTFGGENTNLKFVDKCLDISKQQIVIMPSQLIKRDSASFKKYKEKFNSYLYEIEEVDGKVFNSVSMQNPSIYLFDTNKKHNNLTIKYINGEIEKIEGGIINKDYSGFNIYEKEIVKYLYTDKPNFFIYSPRDKNNLKFWIDKYLSKLPDNKVFMLTTFATSSIAKFISNKTGQILNNKKELEEELYKRKGERCIIMQFKSLIDCKNCKIAMENPLIRFTLLRTKTDPGLNKKQYSYIPYIDWSDDKVKTDEGLLEVCGCPKDKCKEYAEYCKKIIDEVDKK